MTSRRDVMAALGAIGGAMPFATAARAQATAAAPALIVSTWDFGAAANEAAFARMKAGGSLLDAVEAGAMVPEADPENHSVGYGGYPDRDGHVTLDAVIMDDRGDVGAVAALEDTVHAISVARRVMEKTPHTLIVGEGATRFARDQGFPKVDLLTPAAEKAWRDWLKTAKYQPVANSENAGSTRLPRGGAPDHDTIGLLARDPAGHLAGACTTSGMAFKMRGRVGDSPQVGAGLYVEAGVGGATSTGLGEEVTRVSGSARVVASMRAGLSPQAACEEVVKHIAALRGDAIKGVQVGFLALDPRGRVGAFCLLPGFTYAVTDTAGRTRVLPAPSLFRA
ncbi:N4-(beta-N-acetylglucosaminyl)-L-asparaginase [Sphingomonas sp. SORGH_AS802]|uniref:N(4)-(beta-N-acetylglucosaminyl)-L-asparaginase n=1 Tax=unclassified Sphingomonas TaxID=196159 RepID=UPI002864CE3F|nr:MULTISPECIES: N(4)-(beta-N-acetylglucosaminyl)-L-asparaginase [unclassified Sphingomonas]MDR6125467.1 N4-(beta-N-acetylglucosaminyl)-L-asparaginase [Sphingomonas sp. SORGH_AS_0438]MDR6134083.1 N4-(beta-N-acetylglucosaminyl)-L-asparaginase [Sphingomonas sp. SORGH_AS_0802]